MWLVCGLYVIDMIGVFYYGYICFFLINVDGSDQKLLSVCGNEYLFGIVLGGGGVIDWLGEKGDGSVLMQCLVVFEVMIGYFIGQICEGLVVECVDMCILLYVMVELFCGGVVGYIIDGCGVVWIMV